MGQKQKTEKKREREKERTKVGNNNGQLRIATPPHVAHAKPPGPIDSVFTKQSKCKRIKTNKRKEIHEIQFVQNCILEQKQIFQQNFPSNVQGH